MRSLWRSGAIFIKVLREPKKPTETLPECFDGLIRPRPRGLDTVFSTPRLGPLWPVSNWQSLQVCFALFSSISLLAFFWRSWTMRTSSCQIEFVDGAKATIRCGGQVVAECADCGILICSDCRSECCVHSAITAMTTIWRILACTCAIARLQREVIRTPRNSD